MMIRRNFEVITAGDFLGVLKSCIDEHALSISRLERLGRYYKGEHDSWAAVPRHGSFAGNEGEPRLVCNWAKFITDMASGYMFGKPVEYRARSKVQNAGQVFGDETSAGGGIIDRGPNSTNMLLFNEGARQEGVGKSKSSDSSAFVLAETMSLKGKKQPDSIIQSLVAAESATHDSELGKALSVYGYAYELVYFHDGKPALAIVDPRSAFVVYDDTVRSQPLFGVILRGKSFTVYYADKVHEYADGEKVSEEVNLFGRIPLLQYWNNEEGMGDFEAVLSLIDAYNILQSDRIADKQRFVNAILKVTGAAFETDEFGRLTGDAKNLLRSGILQLPEDSDAAYLTKSLSEGEAEILKNAIALDIHKFSLIPDFSDRHFAGNQSGVAMRFKMISIEYLCRVKERFFASGLKSRLELFAKALEVAGEAACHDDVEIVFSRELGLLGG